MASSFIVDSATATRLGESSRPVIAREAAWRSSLGSGLRRRLLNLIVVIVTLAIWNTQLYHQRRLNADVIGRLRASVHSTFEHSKHLRWEVSGLQAELQNRGHRSRRAGRIRVAKLGADPPGCQGLHYSPNSEPDRMLASGEIYGKFVDHSDRLLVRILPEPTLIKHQELHWVGRGATLVQTGNFIDRGPDLRQAALLMDSHDSIFAHDDWSRVLSRFVDDRGLVDYEGLAHDRATFDRYIAAVETTSPKSNRELFPSRNHQLAYYINAYNALVFKGVLARGPEQESIWKGGLVSGYKFFVGMKITVGNEKTSLKRLEDKVIRDGFQDPRVHAALNCASISCPRLPQKAFDPEHLNEELDAAMMEFVRSDRHVRVVQASRTVYLSKIFDWFSKDFLSFEKRQGNDNPNLIDYVNRYRGERSKISRDLKVRFLEYDKGINTRSPLERPGRS